MIPITIKYKREKNRNNHKDSYMVKTIKTFCSVSNQSDEKDNERQKKEKSLFFSDLTSLRYIE